MLGWKKGGVTSNRIRKILKRLTECTVEFRNGRYSFTGHLIDFMGRDDETGKLFLMLSPQMVRLFEADQYTFLDAEQRLALDTYLAKWLDGYLASHARPMPVKVDTIRKLCGSNTRDLKHFRFDLRAALDELKEKGAILRWEIDRGDLMCVDRGFISRSQAAHLSRKGVAGSRKAVGGPLMMDMLTSA